MCPLGEDNTLEILSIRLFCNIFLSFCISALVVSLAIPVTDYAS